VLAIGGIEDELDDVQYLPPPYGAADDEDDTGGTGLIGILYTGSVNGGKRSSALYISG